MQNLSSPDLDVCLVLEATYPYVSGGVSTWVHQLITAFPEWRFGICYLGGSRNPAASYQYSLPSNVVRIDEFYLFDSSGGRDGIKSRSGSKASLPALRPLLNFLTSEGLSDPQVMADFCHVINSSDVDFEAFWSHHDTWESLVASYEDVAAKESFMDFFWTVRYLTEPVWKVARAAASVPSAHLYHCACTGYAGLLGAILSHQRQAPLLLSEHGIYLRERIMDIASCAWISEPQGLWPSLPGRMGMFRHLWIRHFERLGQLCYTAASHITALFRQQARLQERFGAEARKVAVVPNGVSLTQCEHWKTIRASRPPANPPRRIIGFLGRIVPIKDVKTLLRAARIVCDALPSVFFLLAGPTDEDAAYFDSCLKLVEDLQLTRQVAFPGNRPREEVLVQIDVMVLSSISEGLPFVALEALGCGIPLVATDVGACRELIEGAPDEHPRVGDAGIVVAVGDAAQLAKGILEILGDPEKARSMSEAGGERIRRYYDEENVFQFYRHLYAGSIKAGVGQTQQTF